MLNRISIRQRFALGFGILLTILIGLSLFASWRVNEIAQNLQTINHVNSIKQRYAINFRGAVHERAITIRDVVIVPDQVDLNTAIARINLMAANYDKSAGPMDAIMASGAQVTPDEVSILASIKATQAMTMPVIQRIIALRENGDIKDATSMVLAQAKPDFIQWLDQINQFIDLEEAKNQAIGDETAAIADGFFWLNFAACGLGLLLGFTIAWWSMQALGPLKDIVKIMGRIAAGHVNVSIPCIERGDEVGAIARAVQVFKENAVERQKLELAAAQFQRELAAKLKEMEARFEADFATKSALEVARNTAEELSRVKSDFLAAMSHELRTPMNVIIGMSRLCLQTGLEPKQRNYIEKVRRSADHLLGLINQVLDFSKAEAGKLAMEEANFNLDDVMANLANLVTAKAEDKGLDFLFDFAPDVPIFLIGDALRLGQVLVNLASNAIKFTARGEVIIGAARLGLSAHDVELHFWVKDSGIGMTEEQQSRLFQLYGQADATIARTYGGTGLGLAISKKLVEMMDGKIWIESEFGKGSTMHFTARFGLPAKPMSRAVNIPVDLASKRLLVVDDNAAAREILVTMARSFGLHADSAWDGRQATAPPPEAQAVAKIITIRAIL